MFSPFRFRHGDEPTTPITLSKITALLALLDRVEACPCLYANRAILSNAIRRYEHVWLPLLFRYPAAQRNSLHPPLDVHWVWLVHMLCPVKYNLDTSAIHAAHIPSTKPRAVDHTLLSPRDSAAARDAGRAAWQLHFPNEPFDIPNLSSAPLRSPQPSLASTNSRISYDIMEAASRQGLFHYQVSLPHYRTAAFQTLATRRYHMFLRLIRDNRGDICIPTYDIDLVWHVHQLHPFHYQEDTSQYCGFLLPHDDTLNDRSAGSDYSALWAATCRQWFIMFESRIHVSGAMYRGDVQTLEPSVRTTISTTIKAINSTTHSHPIYFLSTSNPCKICLTPNTKPIQYSPPLLSAVTNFTKPSSTSIFHVVTPSNPSLPLASASNLAPNSVRKTSRKSRHTCALLPREIAVLLRVAGSDYAMLAARTGTQPINRPRFKLRVWLLGTNEKPGWRSLHASHLMSKLGDGVAYQIDAGFGAQLGFVQRFLIDVASALLIFRATGGKHDATLENLCGRGFGEGERAQIECLANSE